MSVRISILAAMINLLTCLIFFVASAIPSNASDYSAFDGIFGGTWFILLGSTVAFLASAVINNSLNWMIGKSFRKKPDTDLLGRFPLDSPKMYDVCFDRGSRRTDYGDRFFTDRVSHHEKVAG